MLHIFLQNWPMCGGYEGLHENAYKTSACGHFFSKGRVFFCSALFLRTYCGNVFWERIINHTYSSTKPLKDWLPKYECRWQCLNANCSNIGSQSLNEDVWTGRVQTLAHSNIPRRPLAAKLRLPKYERFIQTSAIHTSAAEGHWGKSFSGCQRDNEYVRLYAPCFLSTQRLSHFWFSSLGPFERMLSIYLFSFCSIK